MVKRLEYRIMQNYPGPGWYWEVVESSEVLAHDLAATHREAVSQTADVVQATREEQIQRSA